MELHSEVLRKIVSVARINGAWRGAGRGGALDRRKNATTSVPVARVARGSQRVFAPSSFVGSAGLM